MAAHSSITGASLVAQMVKSPPVMQEIRAQSLGREHPLEKGMATRSSVFAWTIPWTEEPGRLQVQGVTKRPMQLKQLSTQAQDSLAL